MLHRLITLAKQFNVAPSTLVAFAKECGYNIDNKPTTKIPVKLSAIMQMRYAKAGGSHLVICPLCYKHIQNQHISNHLKKHTTSKTIKTAATPSEIKTPTDKSRPSTSTQRLKNKKKRRGKKGKGLSKEDVEAFFGSKQNSKKPLLTVADLRNRSKIEVDSTNFYFFSGKLTLAYNTKTYRYSDIDLRAEYQNIVQSSPKMIPIILDHDNLTIQAGNDLTAYILKLREQWRKSAKKCDICNLYFPPIEYEKHCIDCTEISIKSDAPSLPTMPIPGETGPDTASVAIDTKLMLLEERLLDICQSIADQRRYEKYCKVPSRGRFVFKDVDSGRLKLWWLYNDIPSALTEVKDVTGRVAKVISNSDMLKIRVGQPISKNSKVVGDLLLSKEGEVTMANGAIMQLNIRATYYPTQVGTTANVSIQHTTNGRSSEKTINWSTLTGLIEQVESLIKKYDPNITDSSICSILNKQVKQLKSLDLFKDAKPFVREAIQLRYQDILSQEQESVKRSNIFDGCTIIIDGGPGTGKTTTLIQRIRFLSSPIAIKEYIPNINNDNYQKITNTASRNWVFYTPTKLLADYLKANLINEGLQASNKYVLVWEEELRSCIKKYGLSEKQIDLSKHYDDQSQLRTLVSNIKEGHLKHLKRKLLQDNAILAKLQTPLLVGIYDRLKNTQVGAIHALGDNPSIVLIWQAYTRLQSVYLDTEGHASTVETLYFAKLKHRSELVNKTLKTLTKDQKDSHLSLLSDERRQDHDFSHESILKDDIQRAIKQLSESHLREKTNIGSPRLQLLLPIINKGTTPADLAEIGDVLAMYRHYSFLKSTFASFLLENLLGTFEAFLREYQDAPDEIWSRDDVCVYIGLINEYSRTLYQSKLMPSSGLPALTKAYDAKKKNILAVDEASDLAISELFCINSFRDYDDNVTSVTLCGDIMQRMTGTGIRDWDDLDNILSDVEVRELRTSYRQSPTLLELAKHLYININHKQPNYKSQLTKYDAEPRPLLYVNSSYESRITWIVNRISEVYNAYGNGLPATAVFVPSISDIDRAVDTLSELDSTGIISYEGYKEDRKLPNKKNRVAVFSVDQIKGLEFEVVLFLDMDAVFDKVKDFDILQRYLYVGLSRAAFYFGICISQAFHGKLDFLNDVLSQDTSWG